MKIKVKKLDIKRDERGWVAEIFRQEEFKNKQFGQVYITTALPGQTKGKHYHKRKTDCFCVIKGKALLLLVDKKTGKKKKIAMGGGNMVAVQIPPNIWHAIKNVGREEMYVVAYVDESFNPKDPDSFYEEL